MSLYDDASLIMIPSGVKTGKVYSQKPMDSDGQFTFTRASEATRLVDGVVTKVRTNSYYKSTDFTASSLFNQYGPAPVSTGNFPIDSASKEYSFAVTAGNQGFAISLGAGSSLRVVSIWMKNFGALGSSSFYQDAPFASTVTGYVGETSGDYTRYHIIITGAGSPLYLRPNNNNGTPTTFYATTPQIESGTYPTEYISNPNASVAVSEGPVANMPRLNSVAGGCSSLKLEPQRTNLITYSEYFGASYWTKSGATIVDNATTSPDGSLNASKLVEGTGAGAHRLRATNATITPGTVTQTIFAKAAERTWILVQENDMGGYYFNLSTGVVGSSSGLPDSNTITSVGDGWYKITVTITTANAFAKFSLYPATGDNSSSYTGDGSSGVYLYGAQLEAGSYATSYIPNYGTTAGVTRVADACTGAGSASTFNDSEGVLFAEFSGLVNAEDYRMISINDGSSTNVLFMGLRNDTGNVYFYLISGGVTQANYISNVNATNTSVKLAVKYKANDVSFYVNGFELYTDTSATMITGLNQLDFNYGNVSNSYPFYGNVNQVLYFPTALTDTELETLTTL